jgi:integrase/recombinase XerD
MTHPMFDPQRRCTPVQAWPSGDQAAWKAACEPDDPLGPPGGYASRWARSTRAKVENGYGRWLGWLERSGQLDPAATPAARATRERVTSYLTMLQDQDYAPYTIANRLQDLGDALLAMDAGSETDFIRRAAWRIHALAQPVKDLNDRIRPAEEVVQLGLDLMHAADHDRFRTPFDRAVLFRDGLAIALLIHRPLRITNYASITLGRQLRDERGSWRLSFTGMEMKTGRPFEAAWPEELIDALERYLQVHRPVLLDRAETQALWVAKGGAQMKSNILAFRIKKWTEEAFGAAINPHTFRHIAATTIATEDPGNVMSVPAVLGHATLETSEQHYNKAKMVDAGRRYQETLRASGRKPQGLAV